MENLYADDFDLFTPEQLKERLAGQEGWVSALLEFEAARHELENENTTPPDKAAL